jgi:hypothetical protein
LLKSLWFFGLDITDAGLCALAESCPRLEDVNLADCVNITDDGMNGLALHCFGLNTLDLSGTKVTGKGVARLGEGCRALKKLDLHGLAISEAGLRKLAESVPTLEDVGIDGCRQITDLTAATLAQHCPGLHTLHLSGTKVTDAGLARLRDAYPALSVTFDKEEASDYEEDEEGEGYGYEYGGYDEGYGGSGSYDEEYDGSGSYDDEYD